MTQEPLWKPSDISPDAVKEAEADGDGPKRRGRIPQSAWPRILEMYKGGATLSAIAREFECTPSAISYIIRKAEAEGTTAEGGGAEPVATKPAAQTATVEPTPPPQPRTTEAPARPAEARPPRPDPRIERAAPEGRRPLTMGGPLPSQPQMQAQPQPSPRQGDIRHSDGRPSDRVPGERAPLEARAPQEGRAPDEQRFRDRRHDEQRGEMRPRPQEHRQHDPRGQDQRGYDNRGGDTRGGDQRGFGNRPPRDDMRPPREMREDRYRDDRNGGDDDGSDIGTFNRPAGHAAYPYRQQRNPARQEALETPTEPADQRMDAAAKVCAELYRAWKTNGGDNGMQALADSLHEMRKVIARMEIEMSASRREEQKPVPIPAYRLNQPAPQQPRS